MGVVGERRAVAERVDDGPDVAGGITDERRLHSRRTGDGGHVAARVVRERGRIPERVGHGCRKVGGDVIRRTTDIAQRVSDRDDVATTVVGELRPATEAVRDREETIGPTGVDRKSTRLNSSHTVISYAV